MIITVTLNPALDKTAMVDVMRPNALNRLENVVTDCGGKGVNVSAMIQALGGQSVAAGFAGGGSGEELLARITGKGLRHDFVKIRDSTRTNLKVVDRDGELTEFNEPGPEVSEEEWRALKEKLTAYAGKENTFVLSGSLCRGLQTDTYRTLCGLLRSQGAAVFLDADGEALRSALEADAASVPDYIKPNRYEILKYFGVADDKQVTEDRLIDLSRTMLKKGIKLCALSMGDEGALFITNNGLWRSGPLNIRVQSSVGAGDSMVGALVYGFEDNLDAEQCFALAMAASAGACTTVGTNPPGRILVNELLTQVKLQQIMPHG